MELDIYVRNIWHWSEGYSNDKNKNEENRISNTIKIEWNFNVTRKDKVWKLRDTIVLKTILTFNEEDYKDQLLL